MNKPLTKHLTYIIKLFGKEPDADELLKKAEELFESDTTQKTTHDFLELGHLSEINKEIYNSNKIDEWFKILLKLILHELIKAI